MRRHVSAALMLLALSLVVGTARTTAQGSSTVALPLTPDPAECQAAPRAADDLLALLADPAATTAATASLAPNLPMALQSEADLPAGTVVDTATAEAIVTTVRQLIACNNAGDLARVFAFYTDDVIRRALSGDPDAALALAIAAPPTAGSQSELLSVRDTRMLADGRVGAIVEVRDPRQTVVAFLVFAQIDDHWLVDGRTDIQASPTVAA